MTNSSQNDSTKGQSDPRDAGTDDTARGARQSTQSSPPSTGAGRGRRWLKVTALLCVGAIGGGIATGAATAYAHGAMRGMWQHAGHGSHSLEQARERVADGAAWVIGTVDATAEQKSAIKTILGATVDDVYPLVQRHRGNRRDLVELLARPNLDEQALESLRQAELQVFDAASARLTAALGQAAKVLTPQQRQQLLAMTARHRR
jgi:periplasmic protein CpxP/Spy